MKNWTPQALRCGWGQCPSVHEIDDGRLLIVGKTLNLSSREEVNSYLDSGVKPGWDEAAVVIDRALLADLILDEVEKAVAAERERCAGIAEATHRRYLTQALRAATADGRLIFDSAQATAATLAAAIRAAPAQEENAALMCDVCGKPLFAGVRSEDKP